MKRVLSLLLVALTLFALVGCSAVNTYMSWTYNVETGDNVKIKLTTNDGYTISSELPFSVSQNGAVISQGTFIKGEFCEQYRTAANTQEGAKMLEEGEIDGHKYFVWSFDNKEWNYCIELAGGKTGILLGNETSQASAQEVFNRLKITIEN